MFEDTIEIKMFEDTINITNVLTESAAPKVNEELTNSPISNEEKIPKEFETKIKKELVYILKTSYFDLPGKIATEFGSYPNAYITPSDLFISVLKNSKENQYKSLPPKILFNFSIPQFVSYEHISEPVDPKAIGDITILPKFYQNQILLLQPSKLYIYRSETPIINFTQDLYNDSLLHKVLDLEKQETSYYEKLEPNKEYYYFFAASDKQPVPGSLKIIENTYITNYEAKSGFVSFTIGSGITKIKLLKEDSFYYLERTSVPVLSDIEKKYLHEFREKMLVVAKEDFYEMGGTGFHETKKYIKLRLKSKKTNKKIDLNLQYTEYADTIKGIKENPKFDK